MSVLFKRVIPFLQGWRSIKSAPRIPDVRFLARDTDGWVFITAYRPQDVIGGCYGLVDSDCGYYENMNPTMWKKLS